MMFACLFLSTSDAAEGAGEADALEMVAREFSPRVEVHAPHVVTLDVGGLRRLLGSPADIGRELQRAVRARGREANVAVAATRAASLVLAAARPGLVVVAPGEERRELAPLPLAVLQVVGRWQTGGGSRASEAARRKAESTLLDLFRRWGLRTLGEVAALPAAALSERIGQDGLRWQRLARGEDVEPLVARAPAAPIEETLELEWPVEGLEPLSFLLPRLLEPLCARLERLDQAAVTLDLAFRLATRQEETRRLQLPAPMRDAKVLRTLVLLHLESHPLEAGVDRLRVRVEPAPARIVQFSLLARALPFPEQMATLLARLGALMGERRVGSAALVDSHRPGAFAMQPFSVTNAAKAEGRRAVARPPEPAAPRVIVRRFRLPVPARVAVQDGRPVRVSSERHGLEGGRVESAAGPWRTSGEWWRVGEEPKGHSPERGAGPAESKGHSPERGPCASESKGDSPERGPGPAESKGWSRDEWDVALSDGAVYRLHRDRATERWFIEGILD